MTTVWDDVEVVVDAKAAVGESPVWDPARSRLFWLDMRNQLLHTFDARSGDDTVVELSDLVGSIGLRAKGGLVAAVADGYGFVDIVTGHVELIADVERGTTPPTRMNDGKCDSRGRFWAGTTALETTPEAGTLYRLDPDRTVHAMVRGVTLSNGLGWSPDDRTFYYVDTMAGGIDAFDYEPDEGIVSGRRRVVDIASEEGLVDGLVVDSEGHFWVALFGGGCVRRYSPDGDLVGVVQTPVTTVTCPMFGGEDLSDLYIASAAHGFEPSTEYQAGALFRCRVGITGMAPTYFGG